MSSQEANRNVTRLRLKNFLPWLVRHADSAVNATGKVTDTDFHTEAEYDEAMYELLQLESLLNLVKFTVEQQKREDIARNKQAFRPN